MSAQGESPAGGSSEAQESQRAKRRGNNGNGGAGKDKESQGTSTPESQPSQQREQQPSQREQQQPSHEQQHEQREQREQPPPTSAFGLGLASAGLGVASGARPLALPEWRQLLRPFAVPPAVPPADRPAWAASAIPALAAQLDAALTAASAALAADLDAIDADYATRAITAIHARDPDAHAILISSSPSPLFQPILPVHLHQLQLLVQSQFNPQSPGSPSFLQLQGVQSFPTFPQQQQLPHEALLFQIVARLGNENRRRAFLTGILTRLRGILAQSSAFAAASATGMGGFSSGFPSGFPSGFAPGFAGGFAPGIGNMPGLGNMSSNVSGFNTAQVSADRVARLQSLIDDIARELHVIDIDDVARRRSTLIQQRVGEIDRLRREMAGAVSEVFQMQVNPVPMDVTGISRMMGTQSGMGVGGGMGQSLGGGGLFSSSSAQASPFAYSQRSFYHPAASPGEPINAPIGVSTSISSATTPGVPTHPDAPLKAGEWQPRTDVFDAGESLIIFVELPGLSRDSLTIDVMDSGNCMILSGHVAPLPRELKSLVGLRRERASGAFSRSINLPCAVDAQQAKAKFDNGVVEVTIKKLDSKRIPVN